MSEGSPSDPYAIVLADLKAQRARIDQAISAIEALRGITPAAVPETQSTPAGSTAPPPGGPGEFLGLTIVDAAKKLLARERRQLTNGEIVQAFNRGGLILNSEDKLNTVGSVLNRRFIQVGDVVRVGRGTWGLKEWYPNRSFKAAAKNDGAPTPTSTLELLRGHIQPNPPSSFDEEDGSL